MGGSIVNSSCHPQEHGLDSNCPEGRKEDSPMKPVEGVLEFVTHADGTGTRLHVCKTLSGSPRRRCWTWIVGYGVKDGIAYSGGNCHKTESSAREAFAKEVSSKDAIET